jgi:SpoIID/LytB domain protein
VSGRRLAFALPFALPFAFALTFASGSASAADELSGADKLRVVYSNQFAWTREGLPLVTVRVAEGRNEVVLGASNPLGGVRVLPDGDGGAEVKGGATWTVRVEGGKPAKVRWHVVVGKLPPGDSQLPTAMQLWRDRGFSPRTFEIGAIFGVKGEVLDSRRVLITISPRDDESAARAEAKALSEKWHGDFGVHPELAERPRGIVEATDEHGMVVRNDAILWFAPGTNGLIEVKDIDKEGGGKESRRYFGKIYVTVDAKGTLAVVNAVPEDKLLAGLVPAEMSASSPTEALKAQAVAGRNELLAKIGTRHLTDPYRLCATQHCQVYAGAGREDARSTAAVVATQGELLMRDSGGIVDTVYSASCGGHTEDNDRAWGGTPDASLRGRLDGDAPAVRRLNRFATVDDAQVLAFLDETISSPDPRPYCARPREAKTNFRWTKEIDLGAAQAKAGLGAWKEVQPLERGVSGRVTRLKISGDSGTKEIRGELEVRRALGGLKSAMFVLTAARGPDGHLTGLTARGGGHGHGIGMCQTGAVGMAESGASYRDILKHYYGSSHLKRMY